MSPPDPKEPPLPAATSSPILPSFGVEEEDELSMTRASHPSHFLLRTLRCQGEDLERAMRLYHHSDLLRRVVPELLGDAPEAQRAVIPLRETTPSPSVIVTRDGQFITCLDETMATDLQPLAYAALAAAMDRDDAARAQARLRARQLKELPAERLGSAIRSGFSHVTREMVHILLLDPGTYEFAVVRVFLYSLQMLTRLLEAGRRRRLPAALTRMYYRRDASLRLSIHLMGAIDTRLTDELLANLLLHESSFEHEAVLALVRHQRGGEILGEIVDKLKFGTRNHELAALYSAMHGLYHPENGPALVRRIQGYPNMQKDTPYWRGTRELFAHLLQYPDEAIAQWYRGHRVAKPVTLSTPYWQPAESDLFDRLNEYFPLTSLFPSQAQARAAQAAWTRRLQGATPPPRSTSSVEQVVRAAPRVGRNQPCPCGSGRKHKQCCLNAPPPAPPEAPAEPG